MRMLLIDHLTSLVLRIPRFNRFASNFPYCLVSGLIPGTFEFFVVHIPTTSIIYSSSRTSRRGRGIRNPSLSLLCWSLHIVTRGEYLQWFFIAFCRDFLLRFTPLAFGDPTLHRKVTALVFSRGFPSFSLWGSLPKLQGRDVTYSLHYCTSALWPHGYPH